MGSYGQARRDLLLNELKKAVNVLVAECLSPPAAIINSTDGAAALCTVLEAILSHCFKVAGRNYWYFIKKALRDKGLCHRETLTEVRKAWWVKNQVLGKGRTWICCALNTGVLFECMQVLSYEPLSEWYDSEALMRTGHDAAVMFQLLLPVFDLQFNLESAESLFEHVFQPERRNSNGPPSSSSSSSTKKQQRLSSSTRSAKIKRRGVILEAEEEGPTTRATEEEAFSSAATLSATNRRSHTIDILPSGGGLQFSDPPEQPPRGKNHNNNNFKPTRQTDTNSNKQKVDEKKGWAPEIQKLFKVGSCEERLKLLIQSNNVEKILKGDTRKENLSTKQLEKQPNEGPIHLLNPHHHEQQQEHEKEREKEQTVESLLEHIEEHHPHSEHETAEEPEEEEEGESPAPTDAAKRKENNHTLTVTAPAAAVEEPSSFEHRILLNRQAKASTGRPVNTGAPPADAPPLSFTKEAIVSQAPAHPNNPALSSSPSDTELTPRSLLSDQLSASFDEILGQINRDLNNDPQNEAIPLMWGKGRNDDLTALNKEEEPRLVPTAEGRQRTAMSIPGAKSKGPSAANSLGGEVISSSLQDKFLDSCEQLVDFLSSSLKNKTQVDSARRTKQKSSRRSARYSSDDSYGTLSNEGGDSEETYDDRTQYGDDEDEHIIREFVLLRLRALGSSDPGSDPVGEDKSRWQEAGKCTECLLSFNPVRRKHHCRNCGGIVCRKCSLHRCALSGFYAPTRVCNTCWGSILDSSIQSALLRDHRENSRVGHDDSNDSM